jgi:phage/plasmid-associated DNA primase
MGKALPTEKLLSDSELSNFKTYQLDKLAQLFRDNDFIYVNADNKFTWRADLTKQNRIDLWKSEDKSVYIGQKQVTDQKTGEKKIIDDIFKMVKEYEYIKEKQRNGVQLFLKDIENFYCVDIDDHKYSSGEIMTGLFKDYPFLKYCPFTLSRTNKLPHFYLYIQGLPKYRKETGIMKNNKAIDLLKQKSVIERTNEDSYIYYNHNLDFEFPTYQWEDIKEHFNIEEMNIEEIHSSNSYDSFSSIPSSPKSSNTEGTFDDDEKNKIFDIALLCAHEGQFLDYDDWIKFFFVMKNENLFDIFDRISEISGQIKYEKEGKNNYGGTNDSMKFWTSTKMTAKDKKLTIATLHFWAKQKNLKEYNKIIKKYDKYNKCMIEDEEEKTEMEKAIEQLINEGKKHDITKFYFDFIRPNKYIYKKEEKENKWFVLLENNRWNQQKEILIQLDFVKEMRNILKTYKDNYGLTDKQEEKYNKILSIIGDSPDKLIKKSNEYCVDDKVTFTPNPYLFCFDNVVYDLKTCEMRNYKFDDYQVMSTGYDWVEPTEEQINEVNDLLCKIYPNKYNRDFALMYFSTGFIGITIQAMLFSIGKGGNGKSFIKSFCESAFGKYAGVLSPINLSYPLKGSGQSNPELAQLENKRIVFVSEPSENLDIDNSTFKKLTGDSKLEARNHQVSKSSIDICGTYCMDANNCPKFKNGSQDAEARRCFAVYYESEFTNDLERIDEKKHIYLANPLYGSSEWLSNNKFALIKILMKYFKEFKENNYSLVISDFIREESRKFLENSDFYSSLFEENNNIKYVKKLFEFNSKTMTMKDIIEKDNYVKLNDIYDIFIESQSYINLPYNEKKSHSKKHFINKISNSPLYKKSFKDVVGLQGGNKEYNILLGYKIIHPYDINNNPKDN